MRTTRRVPERSFDYAPAVAFVVVTIVGAAYIVASKLVGMPAWSVTVVPVALMIGYAMMILLFRRFRQRDDQSGDNFYYMGFIFTLVSLGVSLYRFSAGSGVDEIVRNFGVAIASTIAGIILRIFFNQLRRDPIEIEQISRHDLAEASRRVRRELDQVSSELAHYRRTNQQMIDEGFSETHTQIQSLVSDARVAMEELVEAAKQNMQASTSELDLHLTSSPLKSHLEETAKDIQNVNVALKQAADAMSKSAEEFAKQVSDTEVPVQVVEVKLQPIVEGLEQVVAAALDRVEAQTGEIATIRDEVRISADELRQAVESLNRADYRKRPIGRWFRRRQPDQTLNEGSNPDD